MKKHVLHSVVLLSLIIVFMACAKENNDGGEKIDGDYREEQSMANQKTVNFPTVILGEIPTNLRAAFTTRFNNISAGVSANTMAVVLTPSSLESNGKDIMDVYNNQGVIIIVDPSYQLIKQWCEKQGIYPSIGGDLDQCELFAFTNNDSYTLASVPDAEDANEYLNSFISWVNIAPQDNSALQDPEDTKDVTKLFDYQTITKTYNLKLEKQETAVLWSKPDSLKGTGQVDVMYKIYPLYAFDGQSSNGDYYIVQARVTVHSKDMYRGNYTSMHGGVHARVCGFYLEKLIMTASICDPNNNKIGEFAVAPSPQTTVGSTSYTSGMSWSLGISVTGAANAKGISGQVSVNGGVSFSESSTRQISDLDIQNNWTGSEANFTYILNNLPHFEYLSITDPPFVSTNNVEFLQAWVWRVPSTKDKERTSFLLETTITPSYGSCHFFSSKSDWVKNTYNALDSPSSHKTYMTAPNRIPTGRVKINNSFQGNEMIQEVKIYNSQTAVESEKSTSYSAKNPCVLNVPLSPHDYTVTFKAGINQSNLKTYYLDRAPIEIIRGEVIELNSSSDFKIGK